MELVDGIYWNVADNMKHIIECIYPFDPDTYSDKYQHSLEYVKDNAILVKQLQRLYILGYLTINLDLHEENFGFIYDPETFLIKSVAPAYDFNSAFEAWEPHQYDEYIYENLGNNEDLHSKLETLPSVLQTDPYLSDAQKKAVELRRLYLLSL